jgi:hypothetical protein
MAGVAFAVDGDGVGFATESYAASALYATLANLSGAFWRIRRASLEVGQGVAQATRNGQRLALDFYIERVGREWREAETQTKPHRGVIGAVSLEPHRLAGVPGSSIKARI